MAIDKEAEKRKKEAEKEAERAKSFVDNLAKIEKSLAESMVKVHETMQKRFEDYEGIFSQEAQLASLNAEKVRALEVQIESAKNLKATTEEEVTQRNILIQQLQAQLVPLKALEKQYDKINKATETSISLGENLAETWFGINQRAKDVGKALQSGESMTKNLLKVTMKQLSAANLMGSAYLKAFEHVKEGVKFMKENYGVFGKPWEVAKDFHAQSRLTARDVGILYEGELKGFQGRMETLAAGSRFTRDELQKTYRDMFKSSAAFRQSSSKDQDALTELSKTLERRLGVSASATSGVVESMMLTFGKTRPEVEKLSASLAVTAKNLNMDVNKAFQDLAAQTNNMAKFGLPDIENQFVRLAKVQEMTGISMDSMVSTMEKFTTFEGALNAASKMNAVFGTTIDGLELMDVTMQEGPLVGFIKLREQMEANGIQMDKLNYAQMRSLKDSLGLTEQQIRQFGNVSLEKMQEVAAGTYSADEAMKELQKDTGELETPQEKLANAQDKLATQIQRVVDAWEGFKKGISDVANAFPGLTMFFSSGGTLLLGLGAMKLVGMAIAKIFSFAIPAAATAAGGALTKSGASAMIAAGQYDKLALSAMNASRAQAAGSMGGMGGMGAKAAGAGRFLGMGPLGWGIAGVAAATATGMYIADNTSWTGTGFEKAEGTRNPSRAQASSQNQTGFAPGNNFVSKAIPQAIVGDGPSGERLQSRTQRALNPGDKLSTGSSNTELKLTVNLVGKDGKPIETQNFAQNMTDSTGTNGDTIESYLNDKLSLLFS